jgi:type IX secretion system PorP/SprF family membrane protein
MMNKITFFFLLFSFFSLSFIQAQQDAQYTHYTNNMNVVNPAYAGSRGTLSIGMLGRTQWVNFDDAPKTFTIAAHAPVGKRLGLGLSVISDAIGPVKEQNIYVDASYTIPTSEKTKLAFGLKGGLSIMNINLTELTLPETSPLMDPSFDSDLNNTYPNFGAGLYFYSDKYYLGFSVPNILQSLHFDQSIGDASEVIHGFFTAGYVFDLTDNLKFKPATLVKVAKGAPVSFDISGSFLINEKFELGANYRYEDSISGTFLLNTSRDFRIGYAYDYTTSNFGDFNSGSHEIILLWDIQMPANNVKSPRFF